MAQQIWTRLFTVEVSRSHTVRHTHTHTHTYKLTHTHTFNTHKQKLINTHTHTHKHKHAPCRTSLNQRSTLSTGHYLHNTQQKQQTNFHVLSGIRTDDYSNQAATVIGTNRKVNTGSMPNFWGQTRTKKQP